MAYRNKEATIAEAERLGIDVSNMSWPEMQKVVKEALERERLGMADMGKPHPVAKAVEEKKRNVKKRNPFDASNYRFEKTQLAPELFPDANRIIRYEEELGDELDIEEKTFMGMEGKDIINYSMHRDYATGTFKVKGKTGRRVKGEASIPKENAGRSFDANRDWFEVVEFQGRRGYRYSQFKSALMKTGYFEDYRKDLCKEPNVFYLTGILCVSIPYAHHIMEEIEARAKFDRENARGRFNKWGY